MKLQRLYSLTRQALDDYSMIEDGDRIALGLSGGKDSLTLLHALDGLRQFYPKKFELYVITVDLGFPEFEPSPLIRLCKERSIPFTIVPTEIGSVLFEIRKEQNPCSLCAKMRKGVLNQEAKDLGCNKIAYAHHKDDLIETMLLSLLFEGRFHCFSPVTYLDQTELTVIRPLIYTTEQDVIRFKNQYQLPVCKNPCPADGHTKREYAKNLVKTLETENPGSKERMFRAILSGHIPGWPMKLDG